MRILLCLFSVVALAQNKTVHNITTDINTSQYDAHYLQELKAKASFDTELKINYVFEKLPTDLTKIETAKNNNIVFAKPNLLNLYITNKEVVEKLQGEDKSFKKIANDVYQIIVSGDIVKAKEAYEKKPGIIHVTFDEYIYFNDCITWNDTNTTKKWSEGFGQPYLTEVDWIEAGFKNSPTHAIDSVDTWKSMHTESTFAKPNIVISVIDSGVDVNNPDFRGNVLYAYDYENNKAGNTVGADSRHGSRVSHIIVDKANNNYGGVGVAHDFPFNSLDIGTETTASATTALKALDYIYDQAVANPTQKHIINMSFSINNAMIRNKIKQLYDLQDHKQVFIVAAAGNLGNATSVSAPATYPEVFGVGAVRLFDRSKALWTGSQTGKELDFVADGQGILVMNPDETLNVGNGTSWAAPIIVGAIAHLVAQDPNADFTTIYNRLKAGAKDLGATGFDNSYGWGYARTASALKYAVVEDVPAIMDLGGRSSFLYSFTPKFYNSNKTINRKCYYPNNTEVPFTNSTDGVVTFNADISTANGFSTVDKNINRLRYEFEPTDYAGCTTSIKSSPIEIRNLSTLSITEFSKNNIKCYPNPVQNELTIELPKESTNSAVQVFNILGQQTYSLDLKNTIDNVFKIDVSNLTQGAYIIKANVDGALYQSKFIKK